MITFKVHKKFINEFVFINHFESSQIYEHCSQYGNTAVNGSEVILFIVLALKGCLARNLEGYTIS